MHGAPYRFSDPARFTLDPGGKDGHPFPAPLKIYDETIRTMKRSVDAARMGQSNKLAALRRLDEQARTVESAAKGPSFEAFVGKERAQSQAFGGRTVFDPRPPARRS